MRSTFFSKAASPNSLDGVTEYRGYKIYFDPPPIPMRDCDWHFHHEDYDGGYYDAEGSVCEGDPRHGHAPSLEAAKREIDTQIEELEDAA